MKVTVREAFEFNNAIRYSYIADEAPVKTMSAIFEKDDNVILYGLVIEDIKSLEWSIKNEDGTINTEHKEYDRYMRLCNIANTIGEKII